MSWFVGDWLSEFSKETRPGIALRPGGPIHPKYRPISSLRGINRTILFVWLLTYCHDQNKPDIYYIFQITMVNTYQKYIKKR